MGQLIDLTGKIFGRLKVLSIDSRKNKLIFWLCECECGNKKSIPGQPLKEGKTRSCGCFKKEEDIRRNIKHNMSLSSEYGIWRAMVQRCTNKKDKSYKNYGGRGIIVCERWLIFDNFYEDMGNRPSNWSIDRIDNNKGYSKDNCKWVNRSDQQLNKRRSKNKTSIFTGVSLDKPRNKWVAYFHPPGLKRIYLGRFENEFEAAEKTTEAYYNYHGKFPPEFKPVPIPERLKCI